MPSTPIKVVVLRMEHVQVGRLGNSWFVQSDHEPGSTAYYPVISTALWKAVDRLTVAENINSLKTWAAAIESKLLAAVKACDAAASTLDAATRRFEQRGGKLADAFPEEPATKKGTDTGRAAAVKSNAKEKPRKK